MCSGLWYIRYIHPAGMIEDKKNDVDLKRVLSLQKQFQCYLLSILILLPLRIAFSTSTESLNDSLHFWILGCI